MDTPHIDRDTVTQVLIDLSAEPCARAHERIVALEGVPNVRDLGGIPLSGAMSGRHVKSGLIYRGGSLEGTTAADQRILFDQIGVRHTIDLRCSWELEGRPCPTFDNIEALHIPINDAEIVGFEYSTRFPGTQVIGKDMAIETGGFYASLANPLVVNQLRIALHTVLDSALASEPIYFHCRNGKDRTGILALLILWVLGADDQEILDDYLISNGDRNDRLTSFFNRYMTFCDGDEDLAWRIVYDHSALPSHIKTFCKAVDEAYGSREQFIRDQLQIDEKYETDIREKLTV